jgi:uncharacterized protein YjbJ (UPF0337 family)
MNEQEAKNKAGKAADDARTEARKAADKARAATENAIEEIKVASNQVVDRVRELIEEGNVRRIKIQKDGKVLLEVPLTVAAGAGAAMLLLTPVLAALGALAALLTDVTLVVEREPGAEGQQPETGGNAGAGDAADAQEKTIGR